MKRFCDGGSSGEEIDERLVGSVESFGAATFLKETYDEFKFN
jgi:hypothetical protein